MARLYHLAVCGAVPFAYKRFGKHFLISHLHLHLEYLPAYQPGLNMQERIWDQVYYEGTIDGWLGELGLIWFGIRKTMWSWTPIKIHRSSNLT